MAFKDTDKILVHRDGADYQAEVGPLLGGGGIDDLLTVPVIKGPKYEIWEDFGGQRVKMPLLSGDGKSGSEFLASTGHMQYVRPLEGQQCIDGYIQYASLPNYYATSHNNYLSLSSLNLEVKAYSKDKQTVLSGAGGDVIVWSRSGHFRAYASTANAFSAGTDIEFWLELKFTNVNGDNETLWVDSKALRYRAMRREEIDLSEMEELDQQIKEGNNQ